MVAFIVGNSDPCSPILTTADMPTLKAKTTRTCEATDSPHEGDAAHEQGLIPGIPDDMARKCLARVPFWSHARCKAVSKTWQALFCNSSMVQLRRTEGVSEEYLLTFDGNPSVCQGQLYDPASNMWRKIPPTPVDLHSYGLESFGVVAVGCNVFLIGGVLFDARKLGFQSYGTGRPPVCQFGDCHVSPSELKHPGWVHPSYPTDFPVPSNDVFKFDAIAGKWGRVAPMSEARGSVACAVMHGEDVGGESDTIFVAGGDGRYAQSQRRWSHLNSAELYSCRDDTWMPLPPMNSLRAGGSGAVVGDKFAVFGGYGAPRLIAGFLQVCEQCHDSEVYSSGTQKWMRNRLAWFPEDRTCTGPVAELNGELYMLLGSAILKLQLECSVWCHETSMDWSDRDAGFFALKGELHVVPSEKVSAVHQKHWAYCPRQCKWRTAKLKPKLRYLRAHQACKQPMKSSVVLRL